MWKPFAALLSAALLALPARAEPPRVVASIQPLHSLVAGVMKGVAEPALLVSGSVSEHGFALKPSDARLLASAQILVMVDPAYESFIKRPPAGATLIAMAQLPGIARKPSREGGVWDHDHHHGPDSSFDGHLWLDPANAKVLVQAVADTLSRQDAVNAAAYAANAAALQARLDALDTDLRARLGPLAGRPYVVFHDAYQYFEARYGLSPAGSITVDPDRPASARRLAALRDRLKQANAACVFREPQFPAAVVETLATAANARIGVLDPQGAALPHGPDQYFQLMDGLARGLTDCLAAR
jgi:zinc transport system substrate-binding protein